MGVASRYVSLSQQTAPAVEPVSRTEAKNYLKIDSTADDDLIDDLIKSAREMVEDFTKRSFITQTWKLVLDRFPVHRNRKYDDYEGVLHLPKSEVVNSADYIVLQRAPIQSITSLVTIDDHNNSSTFAASNYYLDTENSRLVLNDGATWPTDLRAQAAVNVTYEAGYGDAATDVPARIRTAIKKIVAQLYDDRHSCEDMPVGCKKMLMPFRKVDQLDSRI